LWFARTARCKVKIANIRGAIEDGLANAGWAKSRLRELGAKPEALTATLNAPGPPVLDPKVVMAYCRQTERLMRSGEPP
jgi:hypothetical protein